MEEINEELKNQAQEWADNIIREIKEESVSGKDSEKIAKELSTWGLLDVVKTQNTETVEIIKSMLAKEKYKTLKYQKENPKLSKWELVMGKAK